ncbi:cohesin domain-containing protein [bacterium]|nr:cohesin domain-containing protein [bacterium]
MDFNDMNKRISGFGANVAALLLLLAAPSFAFNCNPCTSCNDPRPEDTLICGCTDPLQQGEVACTTIAANVGESITIPISVHTLAEISAMGVDMTFPMELLQYDSTSAGDLTADFDFFGGSLHPNGGLVRLGGFEIGEDNIPPDTIGTLGYFHFTVIAPGCGSFCIVSLFDDIASYDPCTAGGGGTPVPDGVETRSWGSVKAIYR